MLLRTCRLLTALAMAAWIIGVIALLLLILVTGRSSAFEAIMFFFLTAVFGFALFAIWIGGGVLAFLRVRVPAVGG
jgi:hypothetical protein